MRSSGQGITIGKYKAKAIQTDMGIFTHISASLDMSMHIQPDIIRHIQDPVNPNIFRTLVYSEPWQIQNPSYI